MHLTGIGVAPLMGLAPARILRSPSRPHQRGELLSEEEVEPQLALLVRSVAQLDELYRHSLETLDGEKNTTQRDVLTVHRALLHDRGILDAIEAGIRRRQPAAAALSAAEEEICAPLRASESHYFAERVQDIEDVCHRLLYLLAGTRLPRLSATGQEVVLVAREIAPSDMATLDPKFVKGILTVEGSLTSHTAILAKAMGIPAVMGCRAALDEIEEGDLLFVDGIAGRVEVAPAHWRLPELKGRIHRFERRRRELFPLRGKETRTGDGERIELLINISDTTLLERAGGDGNDGVGLLRTEFFFQEQLFLPSEAEQLAFYRRVVEGLGGKPLTIRTIDVGGDKEVLSLGIHQEPNSLLGLRGIRFSLGRPDVFLPQLRAILQAGATGPVEILYPMIGSLEELLGAKESLAQAKADLTARGLPFDAAIRQGIMVEIPAAALLSDRLIPHCDFISIGTNDLTQYVTAADRLNPAVFRPNAHFDPGLLRLISMTLENCKQAGKVCSICGEMASDPAAALLLVGLGARKLSVNPASVLEIRHILSRLSLPKAEAAARQALLADSATGAEAIAMALYQATQGGGGDA